MNNRRNFLKSMVGLFGAAIIAPIIAQNTPVSPPIGLNIYDIDYDILEVSQMNAREAMQREEDMRIFQAIEKMQG